MWVPRLIQVNQLCVGLSTVSHCLITSMLPVVVVHGGAGQIPKERSEGAKEGVCAAARAGYVVLQGGGSSMDAVVEAVTQLENNSMFNAGDVIRQSRTIIWRWRNVKVKIICKMFLRLNLNSEIAFQDVDQCSILKETWKWTHWWWMDKRLQAALWWLFATSPTLSSCQGWSWKRCSNADRSDLQLRYTTYSRLFSLSLGFRSF